MTDQLRQDLGLMAIQQLIPDHWRMGHVQSVALAAISEIDRLRTEVKVLREDAEDLARIRDVAVKAPHGIGCAALCKPGHANYGGCNCWKAEL